MKREKEKGGFIASWIKRNNHKAISDWKDEGKKIVILGSGSLAMRFAPYIIKDLMTRLPPNLRGNVLFCIESTDRAEYEILERMCNEELAGFVNLKKVNTGIRDTSEEDLLNARRKGKISIFVFLSSNGGSGGNLKKARRFVNTRMASFRTHFGLIKNLFRPDMVFILGGIGGATYGSIACHLHDYIKSEVGLPVLSMATIPEVAPPTIAFDNTIEVLEELRDKGMRCMCIWDNTSNPTGGSNFATVNGIMKNYIGVIIDALVRPGASSGGIQIQDLNEQFLQETSCALAGFASENIGSPTDNTALFNTVDSGFNMRSQDLKNIIGDRAVSFVAYPPWAEKHFFEPIRVVVDAILKATEAKYQQRSVNTTALIEEKHIECSTLLRVEISDIIERVKERKNMNGSGMK